MHDGRKVFGVGRIYTEKMKKRNSFHSLAKEYISVFILTGVVREHLHNIM